MAFRLGSYQPFYRSQYGSEAEPAQVVPPEILSLLLGITLRLVHRTHRKFSVSSQALFSLAAVISLFVGSFASEARKAISIQAYVFTFLTVALFACQIPVSDAVRRKGVGDLGMARWCRGPHSNTPRKLQHRSESTLFTRHIHFILWFGIIPWFAFLFTLISAIVSFLTLSRPRENIQPLAKARDAPMSQVA
ncbi:uncharacterized protein EV420DRAFT_1486107 [Desarmillaria tabescens]|uniref:Uncharacterized protein n=1 Tax=Armillaria tabescens TaxID=1929756 RepID=A0AA39MN45_ARMTA|nr:uncharacterized protein EV420DRAFT_1486107 [Desarmillaria tabescens]KAK0440013.1 hypothetical protein EV420DRAFT_1486107 [Desarmillaria tabescens]